jgi:hypothetical protein
MPIVSVAVGLLLASPAPLAHHGLVRYDAARPITLKGTSARMDCVAAMDASTSRSPGATATP